MVNTYLFLFRFGHPTDAVGEIQDLLDLAIPPLVPAGDALRPLLGGEPSHCWCKVPAVLWAGHPRGPAEVLLQSRLHLDAASASPRAEKNVHVVAHLLMFTG